MSSIMVSPSSTIKLWKLSESNCFSINLLVIQNVATKLLQSSSETLKMAYKYNKAAPILLTIATY